MATRKSSKSHLPEQGQAAARSHKSPVDEDFAFQEQQWRAERIGWVAMTAIIIAALAGVFGGGGPLARTSATSADGRSDVQYARFARYAAPTALDIHVAVSDSRREIRLRVSDEYLSAMKVTAITPPPTSAALADRQYVFVFDRAPASSAATIRLELEPTVFGVCSGWVAVDDGAPVLLTHFIFP